VKTIIRQNKKGALQEFLFGSQGSIPYSDSTQADPNKEFKALEDKIQILENQVNSLQQKIIDFEHEYPLRSILKGPESLKSIELYDSRVGNQRKGSNLTNSDQSFQKVEGMKSEILSEGSRRTEKASSFNQQGGFYLGPSKRLQFDGV